MPGLGRNWYRVPEILSKPEELLLTLGSVCAVCFLEVTSFPCHALV